MARSATTTCRACGRAQLRPVLTFTPAQQYAVCDTEHDQPGCGLVQRVTRDDAPVGSCAAISRTRRHRLRAGVSQVMEMMTTRDGRALDIGCGDGTLMSFLPGWIASYGIDQVPERGQSASGTYIQGTFPEKAVMKKLQAHLGREKCDIISMISVLGQQDDPGKLLSAARDILADDGVILLETPYLALALMRNNAGTFHEGNGAVFSLQTLEPLVRRCGLKIVRGMMSETDGGSLRLFLTHEDYRGHDYVPWLEQLARLWDEETALHLSNRQTYQAFSRRLDDNRHRIDALMAEINRHQEHVQLIGADAEMACLLAAYDVSAQCLSGAIGRDPASFGTRFRLADGEIDIICEKESRLARPDFYLAPGHMRREVLEHWRDEIMDGVRIIFLTPELFVVDETNYATELGKTLAVTDGPGSVDTLRAVLAAAAGPKLVAVTETKSA